MDQQWHHSEYGNTHHRQGTARGLLTLILIAALVASLLLPLHQKAINRSLTLQYRTLHQTYITRSEQQRLLKATISSMGMPESLIDGAWQQDIQLIPITANTVNSVARTSL